MVNLNKHNKRKLKTLFLLTIIILSVIFLLLNYLVLNHYEEISVQEGKKNSSVILSKCISEIILNNEFSTEELVNIKYNADGEIVFLETNAEAVNKIQFELLQKINNQFSDTNKNICKIPLGTLTNVPFLVGEGPEITVKFSLQGSAKVELASKFDSGGLNQTIHRIYAHIEIDFYSVSPIVTDNNCCSFDFLLCESVIVGDVPLGFSQIQRNI